MDKPKTNPMKTGRKRTGSITLNGKNYWGEWVGPDGERIRQNLHTADKEEALRRLREHVGVFSSGDSKSEILHELEAKLKDREQILAEKQDAESPALSLDDGWNSFVSNPERGDCSQITLKGYRGQYLTFVSWMKSHYPQIEQLRHVTKEHSHAFLAYLSTKVSSNSYNKYSVILKRIWDVLAEEARVKNGNPWDGVKRKRLDTHTRKEMTIEELAKVIQAVSDDPEMKLLIAIGLYTGLRLHDAACLAWGNVDLIKGMIRLIPHKTKRVAHGKFTEIPIHPVLLRLLLEAHEENSSGPVLPELSAVYKKDVSALSRRITRVFASCGIETHSMGERGRNLPDVTFHSLRHSFVSLSANAGTPLAIVQSIVGHSSPAMTRHYFHESEEALRRATAALPDITVEHPTLPAPKTDLVASAKALVDQMNEEERNTLIQYARGIRK